MADGYGTSSLVDERPELVVYIPEAEEPTQAPTVVRDLPVPWFERREAPWVVVAAMVALIGLLLALQPRTVDVRPVPEGGDGGTTAIDPATPSWTALSVPVPESYRTHTANVNGNVDVLAVAELGAAQSYVGSVATADGPTIQQIFSEQAFSISSPTGAAVVAFMPYQANGSPIVAASQQVTFVGTVMSVPADFADIVGAEAASIGQRTGVYLTVVPETLDIVTPVPEIA